jgi:Sulfotransferase family
MTPKQISTPPTRTPRSLLLGSPRSLSAFQQGGTYTKILKCSQATMFFLGLVVYISIILLSPTTGTSMPHFLSLLSLDGWNVPPANAAAEAFTMQSSSSNKACQYTSIPSSPSMPSVINILPNPNRTIALIHVGKAGGVSLRRMTVIFCKLFFIRKKKINAPEVIARKTRRCIDHKFPDPKAVLAHQTKHYFHIESYDELELATATSFLVTLRNPVDRIISTYRYVCTVTLFCQNGTALLSHTDSFVPSETDIHIQGNVS